MDIRSGGNEWALSTRSVLIADGKLRQAGYSIALAAIGFYSTTNNRLAEAE